MHHLFLSQADHHDKPPNKISTQYVKACKSYPIAKTLLTKRVNDYNHIEIGFMDAGILNKNKTCCKKNNIKLIQLDFEDVEHKKRFR